MRRKFGFQHKESEAENHQRRPQPADGEHGQCRQPQQHCDRPQHSRQHQSGRRELRINSKSPQDEQKQSDIRIRNRRQNALPHARLEIFDRRVLEPQRLFTAVEAGDLAAIECAKESRGGCRQPGRSNAGPALLCPYQETLARTVFSAASTLRPRCDVIVRISAAVSFSTFWFITGSRSAPDPETG